MKTDLTDQEIIKLREERGRIDRFLHSPEYLAGYDLLKKTFDDSLEVIFEADHCSLDGVLRLYSAIGEARTARNFPKLFTDRLAEIDELLLGTNENET